MKYYKTNRYHFNLWKFNDNIWYYFNSTTKYWERFYFYDQREGKPSVEITEADMFLEML